MERRIEQVHQCNRIFRVGFRKNLPFRAIRGLWTSCSSYNADFCLCKYCSWELQPDLHEDLVSDGWFSLRYTLCHNWICDGFILWMESFNGSQYLTFYASRYRRGRYVCHRELHWPSPSLPLSWQKVSNWLETCWTIYNSNLSYWCTGIFLRRLVKFTRLEELLRFRWLLRDCTLFLFPDDFRTLVHQWSQKIAQVKRRLLWFVLLQRGHCLLFRRKTSDKQIKEIYTRNNNSRGW